jgi:hypothetical protein
MTVSDDEPTWRPAATYMTTEQRYQRFRNAILVRLKVDIDTDWPVLRDLVKRELGRAETAEARVAELNGFIADMSRRMVYPAELVELQAQVRALIAEVGSLRAELAEARRT